MEIFQAAYCFSFHHLLTVILLIATTIDKTFSYSSDQNALLAFKKTFNSDVLAKNWSSNGTATSICYWIGVSCGMKHQRVIALNLSGFGLRGTLPPHLGNLTFLRYLDMSSNNFSGPIPPGLSRLHRLREMYLGYNLFTGEIPTWFGDLPHLEILSIRNNGFSGSIPNQIGKCTYLEELYLDDNRFTGLIPEQLWNCTSLRILYLENNNFAGSLPLKCSLLNLEILHLNGNQLTGEIPRSINNASKLHWLQLNINSFSGVVPNFGGLRLLQRLYISDNNLSGVTEYPNQELEFLSSLTSCRFLEVLQISENPLNGILPAASIGNLSKSLKEIIAGDCNIAGVIPSSVGNLTGLQRLLLAENQLSGFIPPTLGKLNQLQGLNLRGNQLKGNIPTGLCRLTNIYDLYLDVNVLTGPIPECFGEMNSLRNIYLGSNKLSSSVPSDFWYLNNLVLLNLSSNCFTGQLSSQIKSFKTIFRLDLSHNRFSGDIPRSIGSFESLAFLYLSNNEFEGSIPPSFGDIRGLTTLDLSYNNLSGHIPNSFQGLKFLQHFNVSYNKLQGEIPAGGPFVNFTARSFFNNSDLCGAAKFQVPPCSVKQNRISRLKKVGRLLKYILPPFLLVISVSTVVIIVLLRTQNRIRKRAQAPADISLVETWRRVSYIELARGTDSFSEANLLGRGSFGSVFKATLYDGFNVAVKVFDLQLERAVRCFETECEILGNIRHRNLVRIIGCCSNTEFKALVLGYTPNGNLEKWLYSDDYCLDLVQSLQIAIDVAFALEYLHHGHTFPVVHCDIKPSNVLLDEDMVARLADFGISKLFDDGETLVHTKTLATIGYAAPEYGSEGRVSTNGDVYSYGILLLEMFTRKKPTDDMFNDEMSLKEWVYRALRENATREVAAPDLLLSGQDDKKLSAKKEECVTSIFSLAMKCLSVSAEDRINMIETVTALQRIKAKVVTSTTRHRQYE